MVVSEDTVLKIANSVDTILSTTATATHIPLPLLIASPPLSIVVSYTPILRGLLDGALIPGLPDLLAYAKYLGPTPRTYALSRRAFVLHFDSLRVLDLNLLSAFHAICLHLDLLRRKICF